jgi:hypothetical protein
MQIKDSAISRIAIPYRGTCRGAARRIASLTALDGPSMRTKPLRGHMRLLAAPSRVMSSCSFFDRGAGGHSRLAGTARTTISSWPNAFLQIALHDTGTPCSHLHCSGVRHARPFPVSDLGAT